MKRILTTVVALAAVLSIGTAANAALFVYDVSGTGTVTTVSTYAPNPCSGFPSNCFVNPMAAGSSLTLDITGSAATIVTSSLQLDASNFIAAFGVTLTTDATGVLTGGTGTLVGDDILWSGPASYSVTGTVSCSGGACVSLGLGSPQPIQYLNTLANSSPVHNPFLGTWDLSADLSTILGTSRQVTGVLTATPTVPTSWLRYGSGDLGFPVPEPGSMALVLLGLGGLALRSRKA